MEAVILFFIITIVLELLILVGLFVAYRKLERGHEVLKTLNDELPQMLTALFRGLKTGQLGAHQLINILHTIERFIPWWIKLFFRGIVWAGKIKTTNQLKT
jgi:hypothetical protein